MIKKAIFPHEKDTSFHGFRFFCIGSEELGFRALFGLYDDLFFDYYEFLFFRFKIKKSIPYDDLTQSLGLGLADCQSAIFNDYFLVEKDNVISLYRHSSGKLLKRLYASMFYKKIRDFELAKKS